MLIGGARRRVHQKIVQLAPIDIQQELFHQVCRVEEQTKPGFVKDALILKRFVEEEYPSKHSPFFFGPLLMMASLALETKKPTLIMAMLSSGYYEKEPSRHKPG